MASQKGRLHSTIPHNTHTQGNKNNLTIPCSPLYRIHSILWLFIIATIVVIIIIITTTEGTKERATTFDRARTLFFLYTHWHTSVRPTSSPKEHLNCNRRLRAGPAVNYTRNWCIILSILLHNNTTTMMCHTGTTDDKNAERMPQHRTEWVVV